MPISSGLNSDLIRVGVVLPEDKIRKLSLSWSKDLKVAVDFPDLGTVQSLDLSCDSGKIIISGSGESVKVTELKLHCNDRVESLHPGYGFKVEPVIAGRGFHWEKHITVDLPGELAISVENDHFKLINTLDIEAYVACVATSEMGAEAPAALLAAQTVVARCWSLALAEAKHLSEGFDVCNDDCCQRYQGTTYLTDHSLKAALETRGEVLTYDARVIDARYSKNCGGMVEDYQTVWGGEKVPYLIPLWDGPEQRPGVAADNFDDLWEYDEAYCSAKRFESVDLTAMLGKVDESGTYYRWEKVIDKQLILENLKKYHGETWHQLDGIRIMERGPSARIKYLYLVGITENGSHVEQRVESEYGIRRMFSESFLYSSAFVIQNEDTLKTDAAIVLKGVGWGHGVGLCQMGALGMALDNIDYKKILAHYYPGTLFTRL